MLRFLGFTFLGFVAQILFLIGWVWFHIAFDTGDIPVFDEVLAYAYIWPLMLIGPSGGGGSHGGELFFAPVAAILYATLFAILVTWWKKSRAR